MKLTSVEIIPAKSSSKAVLSFRDPGASNPYNIKSIGGLDADAIISRSYKGSGGSTFYSMSLQNREIPIKIGLNPRSDEYKTYSELRDNLYKMISSSRTGKVQLVFKNGTDAVAAISGFISKFESPLFEKTQEIILTIKCDDPMLKGIDPIVPVRNVDPTLPYNYGKVYIEDKKSTAPHGVYISAKIMATLNTITLYDPDDPSWSFDIVPSSSFQDGDQLELSSDYNNKYLFIVRAGNIINIVDAIAPGSVWPVIFPGQNQLSWNPDFVSWVQVGYFPTYWGV